MAKHILWTACVAVCFSVAICSLAKIEIEAEKQRAFMMKACVDAGASWVKNFSLTWNCEAGRLALDGGRSDG